MTLSRLIPKSRSNLTPTQPVLKVSVTITFKYKSTVNIAQALPKQKGQKWPTFTPPANLNHKRDAGYRGRVLLRRSQDYRAEAK